MKFVQEGLTVSANWRLQFSLQGTGLPLVPSSEVALKYSFFVDDGG